MPYTDVVTRSDVAALIPEEVSREVIQGAIAQSSVLTLGRKLPNMSRAQLRMPVLSSLPTAYFVTGDTGLKQTTKQAWDNKYINAEEVAVIVPIPESVLDDPDYDIWTEIKPRMMEAFGVTIDAAVFAGVNAPATWPTNILAGATAASQVIDLSTQIAAGQDLYDIIMGEDGLIAKVEEDGFEVTGHMAALTMRAKLRGLRSKEWNGVSMSAVGEPIFQKDPQQPTQWLLDGAPIRFPKNNAVPATTALDFCGDFGQLVYAFRQDMTYKILDQAVITDSNGNIIYNLAQQDMVALRAVLRLGWELPNPISLVNTNAATRYPFSVLVP